MLLIKQTIWNSFPAYSQHFTHMDSLNLHNHLRSNTIFIPMVQVRKLMCRKAESVRIKVPQLVGGRVGISTQAAWLQSSCSSPVIIISTNVIIIIIIITISLGACSGQRKNKFIFCSLSTLKNWCGYREPLFKNFNTEVLT